jgi:NADH-quinone oxidoreductase subunit C
MTWREQLLQARDEGYDVLDWLSASDDPLTLTACLIRSEDPTQTRLIHANPPVESVADLFASAAWHERETHEMFGVEFVGLQPRPLLLPSAAQPPLRKATPLDSRVEQAWPGAVDPAKPRRQQSPPGTPWL